jgi:hypothetical protein
VFGCSGARTFGADPRTETVRRLVGRDARVVTRWSNQRGRVHIREARDGVRGGPLHSPGKKKKRKRNEDEKQKQSAGGEKGGARLYSR